MKIEAFRLFEQICYDLNSLQETFSTYFKKLFKFFELFFLTAYIGKICFLIP